jgi:ubiquinone/menaquinone biosynthesis C-methylase UbiE
MAGSPDRAVEIQRQYYTDGAACYEDMHLHEGSGDAVGMKFVHSILRMVEARTILDVGAATGRGIRDLKAALPESFVCGIEPVAALVEQAARRDSADGGPIVQGSGDALPFCDASFDAVCEFAVLHHVADPGAVVREMLRVAKKAVIIADSNRFGQGSRSARLLKLALYKARLWGVFDYLRTSGKGYRITEGDGLSYSYSVYDSFELIAQWADRVILIPGTGEKGTSWFHPLLNSGGVLVCALREAR